jgi:hypothetical protein
VEIPEVKYMERRAGPIGRGGVKPAGEMIPEKRFSA